MSWVPKIKRTNDYPMNVNLTEVQGRVLCTEYNRGLVVSCP